MMPEYRHNLFQILLPLQRVLAPRTRVHLIVPVRHVFGPGFPRARRIGLGILERVAPTHDLPVDDTEGKDVAANVVPGPVFDHALRRHELPYAAERLARDLVCVVADAAEAEVGQSG